MADRQRVYEGRPGLADWGEDLGELNPRVLRAVRAGAKANVMPNSSGVPFAGLIESTKSLPALPHFLGDLLTGGRYGFSERAPKFSLEASENYDALINKYLAEEGLAESSKLPTLEKYGLAAGEMLGQLPVPGKLLERLTKKLPKAAKPAGWLAEYFGPTVDPKVVNYAVGTGVGGTLRTATGEEPEGYAKGGLGRKPIVRKTEEGVAEVLPSKLEGTTIVKPTGNLNLAPAIRVESIKGPEKQTPQSILNQAQRIPGVTKEGFEEATKRFRELVSWYDKDAPVTKSEFEASIPPSEYSKVDLKGSSESAMEHYLDMAQEMANNDPSALDAEILHRLGLSYDDPVNYENLLRFESGEEITDPRFLQALERRSIRRPDDLIEIQNEVIMGYAREIAENDQGAMIGGQGHYTYGHAQRLMATPEADDPGYFEIGVTHPSMKGRRYRHFGSTDEPLIGHIRGTYLAPDRSIPGLDEAAANEIVHDWSNPGRGIMDIFQAKPNSVVIEELQSDAQKADFAQKGALRQVHGTLFKAAIQDALERGADTVYMPTSVPIAAVRGKLPEDYTSIYDQQVVKEGLNPLKKVPGVTVTPIESKGKTTYYEINFTPEAKEYILKGPGQLAPGYDEGGVVEKEEYDEREIEAIVEPLRQKFKQFLSEARGVPRKLKQTAADITEIGPIVQRSNEIPLKYFEMSGEAGGEADAMRHLLFQAQLMRKYGELPAKMVSYIHEYTSPSQPSAEREMDLYNDILGREIGKKAKSEEELIELARRYAESGRAKVLPKEQRGGYK